MNDRDDGAAGCREPGEVAEDRAAVDETLDAILQQVGARRFDQVNERKLVGEREILHSQQLLAPHVLDCTRIDPRVARDHYHANARDIADSRDHSAARNRFLRIRIVETEARHRAELEPRRAGIHEPRNPLAWQQLLALVEKRLDLRRFIARARFERAQPRDQPEHVLAIAPERFRRRVEPGFDPRHYSSTFGFRARWNPSYCTP